MLSRVQSYLLQGIDALPCEVEVDFDIGYGGDKGVTIVVGLPDASVRESIERVRAALANSGYFFPMGKVIVNLAPADLKKEGPLYDLPMAVGMLMTQGVIGATAGSARPRPQSQSGFTPAAAGKVAAIEGRAAARGAAVAEGLDPREFLFAGELALDGRVRPVKGVIAMAALALARKARGVVVPADNAAEAAVVPGIEVLGVRTIAEVVGLIRGEIDAAPEAPVDVEGLLRQATAPVDFSEVRGQEAVKRAIVIAAAGSHNILGLWARASRGGRVRRRAVGHSALGLWASDGSGGAMRVAARRSAA